MADKLDTNKNAVEFAAGVERLEVITQRFEREIKPKLRELLSGEFGEVLREADRLSESVSSLACCPSGEDGKSLALASGESSKRWRELTGTKPGQSWSPKSEPTVYGELMEFLRFDYHR